MHLNVIIERNVLFKSSTASAIMANMTWLLRLILSLAYALCLACLYSGFTQHHAAREKYAHILQGIEGSRPPRAVDPILTPLHFLFIGISLISSY